MKIKLDENIPTSLAATLMFMGHDVDTVIDEGLTGKPDETIWAAAQSESRLLITQDLDFSDIRRYKPGTHFGIILVRLWTPGRALLISKIESLFQREQVDAWQGCFVVLSDSKIRVIKPAL